MNPRCGTGCGAEEGRALVPLAGLGLPPRKDGNIPSFSMEGLTLLLLVGLRLSLEGISVLPLPEGIPLEDRKRSGVEVGSFVGLFTLLERRLESIGGGDRGADRRPLVMACLLGDVEGLEESTEVFRDGIDIFVLL